MVSTSLLDPDSILRYLTSGPPGCFITESFPLRRNMIVKDVTKLVAHKMKVTNPEDFAFYSLIEGKGKREKKKKIELVKMMMNGSPLHFHIPHHLHLFCHSYIHTHVQGTRK